MAGRQVRKNSALLIWQALFVAAAILAALAFGYALRRQRIAEGEARDSALKVRGLERERQQLDQDKYDVELKLQDAQKRIEEADATRQRIAERLKVQIAANDPLRKRLLEISKAHESTGRDLEGERKRSTSLGKSLADAKARAQRLEATGDAKDKELAKLRRQGETLRTTCQELTQRHGALKEFQKASQAKIGDLEAALATAERSGRDLNGKLRAASQQRLAAERQVKDFQAKLAEATAAARRIEEAEKKAKADVALFRGRAAEHKARLDKAQAELLSQTKRVQSLTESRAALQQRLGKLESELKRFRKQTGGVKKAALSAVKSLTRKKKGGDDKESP